MPKPIYGPIFDIFQISALDDIFFLFGRYVWYGEADFYFDSAVAVLMLM